MLQASGKKRKRETEEDESEVSSAKIALWTNSPSSVGPALAAFVSVKPPDATAFSTYLNEEASPAEFAMADMVLAGESDTIQFTSNNRDKVDPGYNCRYMIGIRDKTTNRIHVRPAPLFLVGHHVKALNALNTTSQAANDYAQARNQLGEAFGTKKARAAIRAMERNQVDVGAMAGVSDVLQDMIGQKTGTLPEKEEANAITDSNRPIPHYNEKATTPADVYPLESIIPEAELATITLEMTSGSSIPFKRSTWINTHIKKRRSGKPNKAERLELKIIFYISAMFFFKKLIFKPTEKSEIRDKLSSLPDVIADSLISRFTESTRGSTKVQTTSFKETELMTHALALCLRVDKYACDPKVIASDLGMPPANLQRLFKSLGCVMAIPTKAEQLEAGMNPEEAKQNKVAILRVPLKFPAVSRGRR